MSMRKRKEIQTVSRQVVTFVKKNKKSAAHKPLHSFLVRYNHKADSFLVTHPIRMFTYRKDIFIRRVILPARLIKLYLYITRNNRR